MGKALKECREQVGKEIDDIASVTRIKASYLKAIEEEDFARLPDNVYTKGYIRQYAQFLGLPSEEIINSYEGYLRSKQQPAVARKAEPEGIADKPTLPEDRRSERVSLKKLLVPVAVAVVLVGAYLAVPHRRDVPVVQQNTERAVPPEPVQGGPEIVAQQPVLPASTEPAPPLPPAPESAHPNKRHVLDVVATDRVWVQVIIDGTDKKEALLSPGEHVSYEADQSITVKIGNAAGIRLKYNDREFEGLGTRGQVIKLSFPNGYPPKPPAGEKPDSGKRMVPSAEASPS